MPKIFTLIFTMFLAFNLYAQDWCNYTQAKFEQPPSTFENKLISDRLNHTINPNILKPGETQVEVTTMLKPEYYGNNEWYYYDQMSIFSVYNAFTIRHLITKKLEFQVSATDLIISASEEIRVHGKESLNTNVSFGAKYFIYNSHVTNTMVSLFGQLTIPKVKNSFNTFCSPELRILVSRPFTKHTTFTGNLGGVYLNNDLKTEIVYAVNLKRSFGKRYNVFSEFYRNCLKTGPARNPCKRWLLGFGFYFSENIYSYASFEGGWEYEDNLNDGRVDIGLTIRINR